MTTFIEQCYMERVRMRSDGEEHIIKWGSDKRCYTSRTSTTVFDFQHFSMHDESHSVSILKYIELLLGRQRIQDHMTMGDLWLLLQCAYFHDIGMTLTRKELEELWILDAEFKTHIRERIQEGGYGGNSEMFQAASFYQMVDDLLNGRKSLDLLDETITVPQEDWPVEICTKLRLLVTDYIRRHHADRSQRFFEKILAEDKLFFDGIVDRRLYKLVADISSLHTKDFNALLDLPYEEIAFGDEYIHPQFIAALLRIGDVLDMDNNRFNVRVLEHQGILPELSRLHLEKHHALTHFDISPERIYAVAVSNEFQVCRETRIWFNWVEEEEKNLVYNWNRIAPSDMLQCRLVDCDMSVKLGDDLFTSKNTYHFNFDSRKMHKLLIGDSIYDCRLDCLREYLQNAIDASKVQLWKDLQQNNLELMLYPSRIRRTVDELMPFDFKEDVFLKLGIEVTVSLLPARGIRENDQIHISIRDHGIGMDEECIKGITTIGQGWRAREGYNDVFEHAPQWMKPTGGFGIGIQSAFMVTNQVNYTTRSGNETSGHYIELVSPSQGGGVSRAVDHSIPCGTEVTFDIDTSKFLDPMALRLSGNLYQEACSRVRRLGYPNFTNAMIINIAADICESYIRSQIPNSLFPIYFRRNTEKRKLLPSPMFDKLFRKKFLQMRQSVISESDEVNGYYYYVKIGEIDGEPNAIGSQIILWHRENMDCIMFTFRDDDFLLESSSMAAFKNVIVPKACGKFLLPNVSYYFDVMGQPAGKCLQVSRASFSREFEEIFQRRCRQYLRDALDILIPKYCDHDELSIPTIMSSYFSDTFVVKSDFVRMLFCRLACFASSSEQELKLKKMLCEINDWGRLELDDIYTIHRSYSDVGEANQTVAFHSQKHEDSNSVRECIRWLEQIKRESGPAYVSFVLANQRLNHYNENKNPETGKLPEQPLEALTSAELAELCQRLDEVRASKKQGEDAIKLKWSILNELCREGKRQWFVYPEGWQRFFGTLDLGQIYECEVVVITNTIEDNPLTAAKYLTAFVYTKKEQKDAEADENKNIFEMIESYIQTIADDEKLKQDYPELMVVSVPCEAPFSSRRRWVHLLPGEAIIKKLIDEYGRDPVLKQLTKENIYASLRSIPEFVRLTKWTYRYQVKEDSDSYYSYQNIESAYIRWVTEKLRSRLRDL